MVCQVNDRAAVLSDWKAIRRLGWALFQNVGVGSKGVGSVNENLFAV